MMGRSPCCDESGLKKGPWTPDEDKLLMDYIHSHGHGSWRALPKLAGLNRCGKSCRLRWTNYLRPDIKRGKFTDEEEQLIISLHSVLGNKWSQIATHLQGRTDNEIKNYWNTHLKKKLLQKGIDPVTHQPRADLNLLANLPHLLAAANICNLMNPWDNALRLQADAAQLAKLQLLNNLLHVMGSNPNRDYLLNNNHLEQNSQFEGGLVNVHNLVPTNNNIIPSLFNFSNPPGSSSVSQLHDDQRNTTQEYDHHHHHHHAAVVSDSCFGFKGESSSKVIENENNNQYHLDLDLVAAGINSSSPPPPPTTTTFGIHESSSDLIIPALVSASPDCSSTPNQTENKIINQSISTNHHHHISSTTFEAWGDDLNNIVDETNSTDYYWTDFVDQTTSPSWPMAQ